MGTQTLIKTAEAQQVVWSKRTLIQCAKGYKSRTELSEKERYVYRKLRRDHPEELDKIFPPKYKSWTPKECLKLAKACKSMNDFRLHYPSAYSHLEVSGRLGEAKKLIYKGGEYTTIGDRMDLEAIAKDLKKLKPSEVKKKHKCTDWIIRRVRGLNKTKTKTKGKKKMIATRELRSPKMSILALNNPMRILVTGIDKSENQITRAVSRYGCTVVHYTADALKTPPVFVDAVVIHTAQISHGKFWALQEFYKAHKKQIFVTKKGFSDIKDMFETFLKSKNYPIPSITEEVKTETGLIVPVEWASKDNKIPFAQVAEAAELAKDLEKEEVVEPRPIDPNDTMTIVPEAAESEEIAKPTVHDRFRELYAGGLPTSVIAETLNKEGYRRPYNGDEFSQADMHGLRQTAFKTKTAMHGRHATPQSYVRLQELYAQGMSYENIATKLTEEGFRTHKFHREFDAISVRNAHNTIKLRASLAGLEQTAPTPVVAQPEVRETKAVDMAQLISYVMQSTETDQNEKLRLIDKITKGEITKPVYTEISIIDGIMLIERNNIALKAENNIRIEMNNHQALLLVENIEEIKKFLQPKV